MYKFSNSFPVEGQGGRRFSIILHWF